MRNSDFGEASDAVSVREQKPLNAFGKEDAANHDPNEGGRPKGLCGVEAIQCIHSDRQQWSAKVEQRTSVW
jgi:hypothetical protein